MQVGNAFVSQYYNMLHQSPQVVHRFYTDASHLTRAEAGPDGVVDTVVTQDVCIYPPSKPSLESALFLSLYTWISISYLFSLLAPQEKGYFVLNDIFRYLDEPSLVSKPALSLPNGLPEPPIAPYVSEQGLFSKLSVSQTLL